MKFSNPWSAVFNDQFMDLRRECETLGDDIIVALQPAWPVGRGRRICSEGYSPSRN